MYFDDLQKRGQDLQVGGPYTSGNVQTPRSQVPSGNDPGTPRNKQIIQNPTFVCAGPRYLFLVAFLGGGIAFGLAGVTLRNFRASFVGAAGGAGFSAMLNHSNLAAHVGNMQGPLSHVINGFGIGIAAGVATQLANRREPAEGIRWSRRGFSIGLGSGSLIGLLVWLQGIHTGGIVVGLTASVLGALGGGLLVDNPPATIQALTPNSLLRRDRNTFFASALGLGLAAGCITGLTIYFSPDATNAGAPFSTQAALFVGLTNWFVIGIVFGFFQASWGAFALARLWLNLTGHLPLKLMAFLTDAHIKKGVLRQFGPAYQLRHVELQEHLAGASTPPPAPQLDDGHRSLQGEST